MASYTKLQFSLFLMRITVFVVMFMWALDKFVNPGHAAAVWANYYFVKGLPAPVLYGVAVLQMVVYSGFLLGVRKTLCYGLVLLMHAGSTFLSYNAYLNPWQGHLLFFAALPMLAACYALYVMRDSDTIFSMNIR